MKIGNEVKLSTANTSGRGHRFSAPAVTRVKWSTIDQSFLTNMAADKLGSTSNLPSSTDEINKIAFGCYSGKDLPFILQAFGFSTASGEEFASTKKGLIKQAVATFNALTSMRNTASNDVQVSAARPTLNESSSASLVSASPHGTTFEAIASPSGDTNDEVMRKNG